MSTLDLDQSNVERTRFEGFSMPMNAPSMNRLSLPPLPMPAAQQKKRHGRAHSRNLSLSLPTPAGVVAPTGPPSISPLASSPPSPSPSVTPTTPGFPSKRNSHHRRLSSVSTRHESAEIMGVTIPELPVSDRDQKDFVRRRALLALEGKPDSYTEVEIPQLPADDERPFEFPTKPSFPPGPGLGSSGGFSKRDSFKLLSSANANKDTLGTLVEEEEEDEHYVPEELPQQPASAPPAAPEQKKSKRPNLRPLSLTPENLSTMQVFQSAEATPQPASPTSSGIRSAPLKLKSLSLAAVSTFRHSTISPAPQQSFRAQTPNTAASDETDSFRSGKGSFRSFRASQSFRSSTEFANTEDVQDTKHASAEPLWQSPLSESPSTEALQVEAEGEQAREEMEHVRHIGGPTIASYANNPRRPDLTLDTSSSQAQQAVARRSSISYKTSDSQDLPSRWPEQDRRISLSSSSSRSSASSSGMWFNHVPTSARTAGEDTDGVNTPASSVANFPSSSSWRSRTNSNVSLSASEQHFLFKSHNALLARIQDLEKTLSVRRRDSLGYDMHQTSRPTSFASDFSNDDPEAYSAVAQLRAERDELKQDVDGWRTRVADLEKQLGSLATRMDQERREAWVARSRIGLLDAEKTSMEKLLNEARSRADALDKAVQLLTIDTQVSATKACQLELENKTLQQRIQELERERDEAKQTTATAVVGVATTPQRSFSFVSAGSPSDESIELETPFDEEDNSSFMFGSTTVFGKHHVTAIVADDEDQDDSFGHLNNIGKFGVSDELFDEHSDDDEDGMNGYEDEEDGDEDLGMDTSSSFGSYGIGLQALPEGPITPLSTETREPLGEMSKGWTFPRLAAPKPVLGQPLPAVDSDQQSRTPSPVHFMDSPSYSYETSFGAFSMGLCDTPADAFAFELPAGVDAIEKLGTVLEEEEEEISDNESDECDAESVFDDYEEEDAFGQVAGIMITLTTAEEVEKTMSPVTLESMDVPTATEEVEVEEAPVTAAKPHRKPPPVYEGDSDEDDEFIATSAFEQSLQFQTPPKPRPLSYSRLPRAVKTPPSVSNSTFARTCSPSSQSPSRIPTRVVSPTQRVQSPPSPSFVRPPMLSKVNNVVEDGSQPFRSSFTQVPMSIRRRA